MSIERAQEALKSSALPVSDYDQFHANGEVGGGAHGVYKLAGQGWAFKSELPLTADSAHAVADYLAALDALAPDHITDFGDQETSEAASK